MHNQETLELARALIRINSVNPKLVPGAPGEEEIARFVHRFLDTHGVEAQVMEVEPGRPNVVARRPGKAGGPCLLFCCHMDTVSTEGMEDPFGARLENGKLFGRGSHDVKGGLAAMLAATVILLEKPSSGVDIIAAAVVDEEYLSCGTEALIDVMRGERLPDAAVVFEPSDLNVQVAHKGFAWLSIETQGVAAHGSRPADGVDAIAHMGRVLSSLEALDRKLGARPPHPLLGAPSVHASLIEGGRELSSYPDRCRLQIERRTVPGESDTELRAEVEELLDQLGKEDASFRAETKVTFFRPPSEIETSHPLPQALARAVESATGRQAGFIGETAWADSALLDAAGIPSVVFGPGGRGLHSVEEYGLVQDIFDCRDALVQFGLDFCR